ncbi:MAG: YchJ family metal-binding protein [Arenimonas sp.]
MSLVPLNHCACGSVRDYADCCGRFHAGEAGDNAQKLLRSRYSAYVLRLENYLLDSWHASTRPATLDLDETASLQWLGLEIRSQHASPDHACIEFIARYRVGGPGNPVKCLHEISRFVRERERWYFLSAEVPPKPRSRSY